MNKIKNILLLLCVSLFVFSCGDNNFEPFDHKVQAAKDNDSLVKFFKNFYFDKDLNKLSPIIDGKTSLFDDDKLKTIDVRFSDVDYKLYAYVAIEGSGINSPTIADSVLVNRGFLSFTNATEFEGISNSDQTWINPFGSIVGGVLASGEIEGWIQGITAFKEGIQVNLEDSNNPISFSGAGSGFIFIPSGLGYRNQQFQFRLSNGSDIPILANTNLIYIVNLLKVNSGTDHDNDGIATIDEDGNQDGDPRNDFSDRFNPSVPDYLNRNRPQ